VGENRNFDLRREFNEHLDGVSGDIIQTTSILNGAFADLLVYGMPQEKADWLLGRC
jgi:hypothetical protein